MKHSIRNWVIGIAGTAVLVGANAVPLSAAEAPQLPSGHPPIGDSTGAPAADDGGPSTTGKVVETMTTGGYTYVQVDNGAKKIWAAAPQFAVAVGDTVAVPQGMPMRDFTSKTLGRTFDVVYFVSEIRVTGKPSAKDQPASAHGDGNAGSVAAAHGGSGATTAPAAFDFSSLKKADGGQTVAEVFAGKADLAGKPVAVRGKVVKFTADVMGKNWLHVQDGTGSAGTNDLAVTTSTTSAVGNTVLVRGKVSTDKDYGFGYRYDVIIEDATVVVE